MGEGEREAAGEVFVFTPRSKMADKKPASKKPAKKTTKGSKGTKKKAKTESYKIYIYKVRSAHLARTTARPAETLTLTLTLTHAHTGAQAGAPRHGHLLQGD